MQDKPPPVPARATQGGVSPQAIERRARWAWVQASVWTDRMLEALENGVKGGMWFSLIDNKRRGKAKGADHQRWPNAFFAQLGFYSFV